MNLADVRAIVQVLLEGGVAGLPTEGVWGLSAVVSRPDAIERILTIKARAPSKGLIVLVNDWTEVQAWAACPIHEAALREEGRPSTWVIPVNAACPALLTGGRDSLAVRQVKMPLLRRIIAQTGPIVSTSANRSGRPVCRHRFQVMLQLGQWLDVVSRQRTQGFRTPSTIRDMLSGEVYRA